MRAAHLTVWHQGHGMPAQLPLLLDSRDRELALSFSTNGETGTRKLAADPLMAALGLPLELPLDHTVGAPATSESAVERRRRRERAGQRRHRRKVAALYAGLRAMLPGLPTARPRPVSREEILVAATARVKALEDTAAALEAYRGAPRPRREVGVSRGTVTVTARLPAPAPAGALRRVVEAFERRGAGVLVATLARHGGGGGGEGGALIATVTAAAVAPEVVEMIRADIAGIN